MSSLIESIVISVVMVTARTMVTKETKGKMSNYVFIEGGPIQQKGPQTQAHTYHSNRICYVRTNK